MFGLLKERRSARRETIERRAALRERVLLGGKIVYGAGFTLDCRIRDLGRTGARIVTPPHEAMPHDFHLIVVREGVAHHARRQWATPSETGVAFTRSCDLKGAPPPGMEPLRSLWAELALRP